MNETQLIAIFGRLTEKTDIQVLVRFFRYLWERQLTFSVYEPYFTQLLPHFPADFPADNLRLFNSREELVNFRCVYSFGGDGTVLEAVRFIGALRKPILGVNFGRLGYLANITQNQVVEATEELLKGMYRIEERSLLHVSSDPEGLFGDFHYGINDLTIHKSNTNEMITVHTYVNGEFLNSYWGDGLIIATPTGSTAYSLSCGGPVIFPTSETFTITPVAPHSLTVRPVVIPDSWVLSFEIASRSGLAMVALDTRTEQVKSGTSLAIRKGDFKARLIRLHSTNYIANLRSSLMWGSDSRN
jgi:NAD+ kinase